MSDTRLPTRLAVRSFTGSGSLSEGGWGAPGVPHPASPILTASATHAILLNVLIALPVYWSGAGVRACSRSFDVHEGGIKVDICRGKAEAIAMEGGAEKAVSERCKPGAV